MSKAKNKKLTVKQKRFVDYYIITHGNATEAARRAGYKKPHPQGAENLLKPTIRAAIDAAMAEIDKKARLSKKEAVEILTSIARGEIRENNILVETRERGNGKETSKTTQKMQNTTSNRDRLRAVELMAKIAQWDQPEDKEEPIQYFFERGAADDTKN